jgi:hypothetical protein
MSGSRILQSSRGRDHVTVRLKRGTEQEAAQVSREETDKICCPSKENSRISMAREVQDQRPDWIWRTWEDDTSGLGWLRSRRGRVGSTPALFPSRCEQGREKVRARTCTVSNVIMNNVVIHSRGFFPHSISGCIFSRPLSCSAIPSQHHPSPSTTASTASALPLLFV